jgi:hypothetical protein
MYLMGFLFQRGYKSPTDLENRRALNKLSTFFPTARLIIGIRHPIRWFESFYNFRVQNSEKKKMPPATEIGMECWKNTNGVCGGRAMFHNALAGLGKTPMSDDSAEMSLFDIRGKLYGPAGSSKSRNQTLARDSRIRNQVFIYDLEQLGDSNDTRRREFRKGVQNYLGLHRELDEVLHIKPGKTYTAADEQRKRDDKKIDICHDKFIDQRAMLLEIATNVQEWIRSYFLESSDVFVANREHFLKILDSYKIDPCI